VLTFRNKELSDKATQGIIDRVTGEIGKLGRVRYRIRPDG
jgi:hypothetical protein